jgi:hypothetical protein
MLSYVVVAILVRFERLREVLDVEAVLAFASRIAVKLHHVSSFVQAEFPLGSHIAIGCH